MKIVFMGTPDFAVPCLKWLAESGHEIAAVFTQPDKPKGRGYKLIPTPVKAAAQEYDIPVYQPTSLRKGDEAAEAYEILKNIAPELIVVTAYGQILPKTILDLPKYGCVNIHASILPKYRGAAPIQWAVLNGDKITGVTTMYLASEMDTGDIIYTAETEIGEYETSGELFDRLKDMGAELLVKTLRDIDAGTAPRAPQDHSKASYVTMLDKSICPIEWNKTPREVLKHIYGLQPWPVATMELEGKTVRVFAAKYTDGKTEKVPGAVVSTDKGGLEIACADGETLLITELQAPGKKRMGAEDYLRGHQIKVE